MNKFGIIYKITNLINNKVYIGKTISSLEKRFNAHFTIKRKYYFQRALHKYGRENFKIEQICSSLNINNLDELEKYFINYYNSIFPYGYNLTFGGEGGLKSKQTRINISLAKKGKPSPKKGKKTGPNKKLSEYQKGRLRGPQKQETIEKRRLKLLGQKKSNIQICFKSITDASIFLKCSRRALNNTLTGWSNSTKNYKIKYISGNEGK